MFRTVNLLQKEGRLEIPKTWLSFTHPNKKDEDRGMLLVSMSILPKAEADGQPVGEAQEEPNENPKLEKPTEGRGFVDKLAGAGLNLGKIKMPKINMFRNFLIIGGVVVVVFLILVLLIFFKP